MPSRIISDHRICGGQPVIAGTRIPAHVVLDLLAGGDSPEAILRDYPQLSREDILAVLAYAAGLAREEVQPVLGAR